MKESAHPIRNVFLIFLAGVLAANITIGLQSWFGAQPSIPAASSAISGASAQSTHQSGFLELFFGTLWLPLAAVLLYLWLKARNNGPQQENAGGFGRSKARLFAPAETGGISLDDIAGLGSKR